MLLALSLWCQCTHCRWNLSDANNSRCTVQMEIYITAVDWTWNFFMYSEDVLLTLVRMRFWNKGFLFCIIQDVCGACKSGAIFACFLGRHWAKQTSASFCVSLNDVTQHALSQIMRQIRLNAQFITIFPKSRAWTNGMGRQIANLDQNEHKVAKFGAVQIYAGQRNCFGHCDKPFWRSIPDITSHSLYFPLNCFLQMQD